MEGYIDVNRWIDLSCLPRKKHGERLCIDWKNSVGKELEFLYNGISGKMKILHFEKTNNSFVVQIEGYSPPCGDVIYLSTLQKCELGRILKKKIIDTAPEIIQYLKNKDDAYIYTKQSNKAVEVICPICGYEKIQSICNLYSKGFFCPRCSDGVSFPNKLMNSLLKQLKIDFINEVSGAYSGFDWVGPYKYDFYFEIDGKKVFIELDGGFHYTDRFNRLQKIQKNDEHKKLLSLQHGIQLIRIDCNYPSLNERFEYIRNNIIKSELQNVINLNKVDWQQAYQEAISSYIVLAAKYWNAGSATSDIADALKVDKHTVTHYLKVAVQVGICDYTEHEARKRIKYAKFNKKRIPIVVYKDGRMVGAFQSTASLVDASLLLYGVHMHFANISKVCHGKLKHAYGYTFKQISYDEYQSLLSVAQTETQDKYNYLQEVI